MDKKKISLFYKALIIYIAVFISLCAVGLCVFADYLYNYERSLPENFAENFVTSLTEDDLDEIMNEVYPGEINNYEDKTDVYNQVYKPEISGRLEFYKAAGVYKEDAPAFNVFSEKGVKLFLLKLEKCGEYRYNLSKWNVESVEVYSGEIFADKFDITVYVPLGSELFAYGNAVSAEYIAEAATNNVYVKEFDSKIATEREYSSYYFENMSIVPELSVIFNGEELNKIDNLAESREDSHVKRIYLYPDAEFYTAEFTAPSTADVSVNGISVSEAYITNSADISDANEFETENKVTYNTYFIEGLIFEPIISVKFNGRELTAEDKNYVISDDYKTKITVNVPNGAEVNINGTSVSDSYEKESPDVYGVISQLSGYIEDRDNTTTYRITGFYSEPEVEAKLNGTPLVLINKSTSDSGETVYDFVIKSDSVTNEEAAAFAEEFLRDYVNFVACGYVGIDENHKVVMDYTLARSPAYNLMKKSYDSVKWNSKFGDVKYDSISITDFVDYYENCVGCTISFDVTLSAGRGKIRNYVDSISIIMIKNSGEWKIADITFGAN